MTPFQFWFNTFLFAIFWVTIRHRFFRHPFDWHMIWGAFYWVGMAMLAVSAGAVK